MQKTKAGFTLIELLVVVLIIGILSAIALPQYQKSVEKARAMQALSMIKAMIPAIDAYVIENGDMPKNFDDLSISLPADWSQNTPWYSQGGVTAKSNGHWSAQIEWNSYVKCLQIGALTGVYKGAGFTYCISSVYKTIPTKTLLCSENYSYIKDKGRFCVKLFNGTLTHNATDLSHWILP